VVILTRREVGAAALCLALLDFVVKISATLSSCRPAAATKPVVVALRISSRQQTLFLSVPFCFGQGSKMLFRSSRNLIVKGGKAANSSEKGEEGCSFVYSPPNPE
jgi:hypothetical protein